jgi:hypothetical protein
VDTNSAAPLNSLYRFEMKTNVTAGTRRLFETFYTNKSFDTMSHVLDGVVHFRFRAYDRNGAWMNINYTNALNFDTFAPVLGETGFYMFSNTLPGSVEIELGVLEDRALRRAESLPNNLPAAPPGDRRTLYLQNHAGQVHIFRQHVMIPNVDPSAYR